MDLYAIGDLGDTTDDVFGGADILTGGGDASDDGSDDGGGFAFADQVGPGAVPGAAAAVQAATGTDTPDVVQAPQPSAPMVVPSTPSAPIGPGTTTPTASWGKYAIGGLLVAALAYFGWKWMNKPKRNPRRKKKSKGRR